MIINRGFIMREIGGGEDIFLNFYDNLTLIVEGMGVLPNKYHLKIYDYSCSKASLINFSNFWYFS